MRLFLLASALTLLSAPMAFAADDHATHDSSAAAVEAAALTVEKAQEIAIAAHPGTVVSSAPDAAHPSVHVFDIQQEDGTVVQVRVDTMTGAIVPDAGHGMAE